MGKNVKKELLDNCKFGEIREMKKRAVFYAKSTKKMWKNGAAMKNKDPDSIPSTGNTKVASDL